MGMGIIEDEAQCRQTPVTKRQANPVLRRVPAGSCDAAPFMAGIGQAHQLGAAITGIGIKHP